MPTTVDVDGVGMVEFPDSMSQDEIHSALTKNFAPKQTPVSPITAATSGFTNPIWPPGSLPTMDDLHGAASDFLGLSKPPQPSIPLTADDIAKLQDQLPKTGEERAARDYAAARAAGLGMGNVPAVPPDLIGGATKILGQGAAQALNIIPNAIQTAGRMTGSPRLAQAGQDLMTEQGKPVPGAGIISDAAKMAAKTFLSSKGMDSLPTNGDHPIAEGLSQSVKGATDLLLTPEGVATLPLLEAKVVRAIMAGDSALKTPESIRQTIAVLKDPNSTTEQKVKAIGDSGVNLAMTVGLAHSLGEHAPSLASELRKEDINYQDAIKSPAYRDAIDQEAQWALDPNNDGVYRRVETSGYQQPEEAATPVATTNPGGSQSDLSPEQQAISKKNNSREAFEALQKKVDEEKASESKPETLKETEQDPAIQEAEPQVADNGEIVGMGGAVQSEFGNSQQSATSIKNATVDAERAKRGLPPAMQPARKGFQEVWDRAMAKIDVDPASQDRLIDELQKHPRAITDEEDAMLLHRQVDLQNEYAKSTRNMAQAFDDGRMEALATEKIKTAQLSDQLQDLYKINKKAGTETARGLNARKMAAFEDFSLANMEMEARADRGGRRLNDSEMETLKKQHSDIVAAKKSLDEHVAKQDARISELEAQKAIDKITRESAPKIHPKVLEYAEKFVKGLETAAESASKRILDRLSRTSAGLDPTLLSDLAIVGSAKLARGALELSKWTTELVAKFGDKIAPHIDEINKASEDELERQLSKQPKPVKDRVKKTLDATQKQAAIKESIGTHIKAGKTDSVTNLVQQLARSFVEQGIKGRDALIDAVHAVLKESDPEITRRETMDAISGYGDFKPLSKDQISLELRDLKGQMQQIAKLEDIQAKQPIQKTGVERRAPSDEERRLIQQVNEAKRRHGVVVTDPARQLKSSLDAIKTNLRNRISDLEYQIAQGKKTVKTKTNVPLDAETTDLKAQRDALKEQFDAIFGKPEMTDGQRIAVAKNALEKSIAEYERRIKEGDLSVKKAVPKTPETPELQVLKAHRDALRSQLQELKDNSPESIAAKERQSLEALKKTLEKQISEQERRLEEGDFSPKSTSQNRPSTPEIEVLKQRRDNLSRQIVEARKKPETQKEAEAIQRQVDALSESIAEKQRKLNENDLTPKGVPHNRPSIPELESLKQQRDALNKQISEARKKPSEQQAAEKLQRELDGINKRIVKATDKVMSGDISIDQPRPRVNRPMSPELEQAKQKLESVNRQLEQMRKDAVIRRTPEQIANQSLRTRLTNRIAELEAKTAAGDFSPNTRNQITLDPESQKLKAKFEQTKQNFQDARFKARMSNRTFGEKFQDTFVKWGRASILSSPGVLLKLASAATERIGFTPLEEGAGSLARRALPDIASRAPREGGGFNTRIEAKAIADAVTKGMQDAWQTLTKGKSDLELNYGKHQVMPRTWLDFFGSVHGALKAPAKRAEFSRSFEKRVEFAIKNGADVSDPLVQTKLALDAYKDSQRSIFLQDNFIADRVKRAINSFEEKSKLTGKTPAVGKATSTILRILLPIIKVPTNIVAETAQYSTGLATGLYRARASMKAGIENLHPDQADLIMRDLKKGSLGAAGLLLGFLAPDAIGGYYQHEEKRKAGDVKPGGARVAGIDIPSIVMHNPLLATVQIGSTIRRVMEKELKAGNDHVSASGWGLLAGGVGLVEETPFVREMYEISKLLTPSERKQALANLLSSRFNPQFVQAPAAYFDKNDNGKPINRKPTGFGQRLEMGIPGLRQQVPVNAKKPEKD